MRLFLAAIGLLLLFAPSVAPALIFKVAAGSHDRSNTPLVVTLPAGTEIPDAAQLLDSEERPLPFQMLPGGNLRLVFILPTLPAGKTASFQFLSAPKAAEFPHRMTVTETDEKIVLASGLRPVLCYIKTPTTQAVDFEAHYTRTGYLHPLYNPAGQSITGDYPVDHPHQHGLFFAWTKTTFRGHPVNFWAQSEQQGEVAYQETGKTLAGPVFAQFVTTQIHSDLTEPGHSVPVLEEKWMVRAYDTGDADTFLIDIKSSQRCVADTPLTIHEYRYGGMAIRGNEQWFDPDKDATPPASFLTSEGKSRIEGNHTRPHWVDLHGLIDGKASGVAVFGHPDNFRAPQPVRLHPNKPYFVWSPLVLGDFQIGPADEKPFVSQYRYLVHLGEPDPDALDRIYRDYSDPPVVTILPDAAE